MHTLPNFFIESWKPLVQISFSSDELCLFDYSPSDTLERLPLCLDLPLETMEAQAWICLYNILSTKEVMEKYQLNTFRVGNLTKLQSRYTSWTLIVQVYRAINDGTFMQGYVW